MINRLGEILRKIGNFFFYLSVVLSFIWPVFAVIDQVNQKTASFNITMPDGTILADVPESIQEKELFDKLSRNGYYVTPEWVKTQIKTPKKSNIFKTVICPLVFLLVIQWIYLVFFLSVSNLLHTF
jgi:hypothetical protein